MTAQMCSNFGQISVVSGVVPPRPMSGWSLQTIARGDPYYSQLLHVFVGLSVVLHTKVCTVAKSIQLHTVTSS